jgi:heme exporter protein D
MNWSEFFHMGGYAAYVWTSYALGFVVLLGNLIVPIVRRKQVVRDLARKIRRDNSR